MNDLKLVLPQDVAEHAAYILFHCGCELCKTYSPAMDKAIEKAKREASLDQLSAIDQDHYKDTVNPLKRADNG